MSRQPEITDEELERFKNFDSLLNKHYRSLNEKKPVSWKIIVPAVILAGSVFFYWLANNNNSMPAEDRSSVDGVVLPAKNDSVRVRAESFEPEKEKSGVPEREKSNTSKTEVRSNRSLAEPTTDSVISIESEAVTTPAAQTDSTRDNPSKTETVYVQAEPVDGYEALYAYFSRELIYPEVAVRDSVEGVLIVKFLINKEGKPEKIETSGALGVLFDKEAIRLIEHMPLWKPATLNGKPVISKLSLPLTFQLHTKK